MNSRILEKIIAFRSTCGTEVIKELITKKISYQFLITNRMDRTRFYLDKVIKIDEKSNILILEALAAREYWKYFKVLIERRCDWKGRKPHGKDCANILLDIGYHYLVGVLTKEFDEIDLPYQLGILHVAQSKSAKPLIYDYMEWIRPILVDQTLLSFIRKKKKKIDTITPKDIAVFIIMLKTRLNRKYYHKQLRYCITLDYWIKLNAISLMSAINHQKYPSWSFPSMRHESRCRHKKTEDILRR
jgi:CRISPR-associated endonuclease Cas1